MSGPDDWLDFGYWLDVDGRRGLVTWFRRTGQVHWLGPRHPELLATIHDEAEVRRRMAGWEDHVPTEPIDWVRVRLGLAGCPACAGEGWIPSPFDDGPSTVICGCRAHA